MADAMSCRTSTNAGSAALGVALAMAAATAVAVAVAVSVPVALTLSMPCRQGAAIVAEAARTGEHAILTVVFGWGCGCACSEFSDGGGDVADATGVVVVAAVV